MRLLSENKNGRRRRTEAPVSCVPNRFPPRRVRNLVLGCARCKLRDLRPKAAATALAKLVHGRGSTGERGANAVGRPGKLALE